MRVDAPVQGDEVGPDAFTIAPLARQGDSCQLPPLRAGYQRDDCQLLHDRLTTSGPFGIALTTSSNETLASRTGFLELLPMSASMPCAGICDSKARRALAIPPGSAF